MGKYDLLEDIANYENWIKIVQIDKGWSHDKKFYIEDKLENKFLLRLCDANLYEKKKEDFHILSKLYDSGIPMGMPIDFGYCGNGECSYLLFSWVDGDDAIESICELSNEKQYILGYESGVILKKIHSIKAPSHIEDWESRFNKKIDIGLKNYKECGITIENEEKVMKFIAESRAFLKNRPSTFQHGDYHLGNFIINDKKELKIIDFNRCDYGDPWEEFNRLVFTYTVSEPFAVGSIHGYFENNVPDEFFKLLALYCARDVLASIPWSIPYGEEDIKVAIENGKKTIESYDGFEKVIPSWYRAP
ncbi:aminoglycoside phosphotransferase family protein [Oceanirhabdus seepicola]|uniref:Phosphotransferase n=1 Tax=Oceanirhabdus seepicola TaxID=2828781 RepID=A0A9J6P5A6_9CLOT|nr:phosphotransferase [Oceanirhabdus seepicola]MCM1991273.1 phosphotransferase [Oceanirhabdus seepicola]